MHGGVPRLDELGRLVGDPSRAAMLGALMDGRAWTGRELANFAHVSPSTASSHLQRLLRGDLITVFAQGRHRYYRIASPYVAAALESLMALAPPPVVRHPTERRIASDLCAARLCYDHLAGKLGVALADSLVQRGAIVLSEGGSTLTKEGSSFFDRIGARVERSRRPICRACLDWSERRAHVAGTVGASLATLALEREWVRRKKGSRALAVTPQGANAFRDIFGIADQLSNAEE